jgi:hypothetical protein
MQRRQKGEHQDKNPMLSPDALLTSTPAAGILVSHHAQAQLPSVSDYKRIETACVAGSDWQRRRQNAP